MTGDESCSLSYRENGSDKVYLVSLEGDKDGNYLVNFQYGRRGNSLTSGTKTASRIPYDKAKKIYDKLVDEKVSKGYKSDGSSTAKVSAVESRDTGLRPQLLNEISAEEVDKYIEDPQWCAQEKYDGRRRMIIRTLTSTTATNRKGQAVAIDENIIREATSLAVRGGNLDGEDMGSYIMLFDLLQVGPGYKQRYQELEGLFRGFISDKLKLVYTAWTAEKKRRLLKRLKAENAEGIVFKRIDSLYIPGRPNKGGDQLKYKFVATATCQVNGINPVKRSVSLIVYDGDVVVPVGNVTVYPNQEIPKTGDIVEVKYLYYFKGGSLFQPVLKCTHDDQDITDCTLSQLKIKRDESEG